MNLWYLDDRSFVGQRSTIASMLEIVRSKGPSYGLQLNMSKCEDFWPTGDPTFPEFPSTIERVAQTNGGAELLGSPVWGSNDFFKNCFSKRIDKIWECQQNLQSLENPQVELQLLRSCLSLCKINHLLRNVPPDKATSQLRRFDVNLRKSLLSFRKFVETGHTVIRLGGLGLRVACRSAPASYLASCNSTRQLTCRFHYLLSQLKVSFSIVNEHTFPGEQVAHERLCQSIPDTALKTEMTSQQSLQSMLDSGLSSSLKDSASIRDRARLNTICSQHAGAWLRALPNLSLGLAMPSKEFSVAWRVWLGILIFNLPSDAKRCTCGAIIDKFGDHLFRCNQEQNLRMKRHNALCEVVFNVLLVDDSRCRREMRCSRTSNSRPGDIFHPNFEHSLLTYFEMTVRNFLQPSYLLQAATCQGAAAAAGEIEKDQRHDAMVSNTGGIFNP